MTLGYESEEEIIILNCGEAVIPLVPIIRVVRISFHYLLVIFLNFL